GQAGSNGPSFRLLIFWSFRDAGILGGGSRSLIHTSLHQRAWPKSLHGRKIISILQAGAYRQRDCRAGCASIRAVPSHRHDFGRPSVSADAELVRQLKVLRSRTARRRAVALVILGSESLCAGVVLLFSGPCRDQSRQRRCTDNALTAECRARLIEV